MNMELIRKIESNISELEERLKKNSEFVSNANSSIQRLKAEKLSITDEANRVSGALQAFKFVLNEAANTQTKDKTAEESAPKEVNG